MSTPGQENVKQEQSTIPVSRRHNAGQSDVALEVINIDPDDDLLLRASTELEAKGVRV
jgi:hypothetical protein